MARSRFVAFCLAGFGALALAAPASAQTGLVAAYGFNENTGTTTADQSGNAQTGSISGASWNAAGRFGAALSFNGSTNMVTVADSALLDLTTGMTLEAWVNPSTTANWRTVILKEGAGVLAYSLYASDNNSRPSSWIRGTGDVEATASAALASGTWVHLAATYNGSTLVLYVNGVQAATRATTAPIITSTQPLRIGGNAIWGEYFSGLIDEVRIYNRALTAGEIQTDMITPVGGTPPPDTTSPTVSITAPGPGSNLSGSLSVDATASDNMGVAGVQFRLDGVNLGAEDLTSPYSIIWNTATVADGPHSLTAVARDAAGNVTTSTPIGVTVGNAGAPTFSLSGTVTPVAIGNGTTLTLSGTASATVTANASGVYSFSGLANGPYTITPSRSGHVFTPANRSVTVSGGNLTGLNFTGSAAVTGIQLVQRNFQGYEQSESSISASFPSSNTAGNFLIVTGTAARPAGTLTITDTAGNTYLPAITAAYDPGQNVNAYIWYVPNAKAGPNTVTLTPTSSRALEIHISEWRGVDPVNPLDKTAWAAGLNAFFASSPSVTPAMNGELIFGYTFIEREATAGPGFTPLSYINGDLDEYMIQAVAAPVAATFTQEFNVGYIVLIATFRPAVIDTTQPDVAITTPAAGGIYGPVTVTASASDNVGVLGVQFRLDGVNLGAEVMTAPYSVPWNTATASEGSHTLTAIARDAAGNVRTSAAVIVNVQNTTNPGAVGQWSAPTNLGLVAVNMVLLRTGRILMYTGSFTTNGVERVWDPITGVTTLVPNPYFNLFCSGHSQLADGRILIVGGYDASTLGAADANIFDPVALTWTKLPDMAYRRWYPTATTLPDGKVLVMSGAQTCLTCLADVPELFDPATSQFTPLTSARLAAPYYPFMYVLPDGRVIDAGANEQPYETRTLDRTTWTWTMVDPVVRDGHSSAMYRPGKILKTGTAGDSGLTGNAASTAYVLDMTQPSPAWRQVASMAFPRAFQNTILLPDGTVLVTGGGTARDGYDIANAVKTAELWSPTTETWKTLVPAALPRLYHSTALLLPDGRVLTAGSGNDGPAVDQTQAEFYSPPYLFKGARPTITSAPGTIQYGAGFTVQTPDAASIASIALIRPGAVTHSFDEDQRFLNLTFVAGAGTLTVQAPANANLAPPGYYMLFIVNTAGVPSVAPFVHLPASTGDTTPPTAPGSLMGQGGIGTASLTWTAAMDNIGVSVYNVHRSTVSGFVPSAGNRVGQPSSTSFGQTGVAPGTYYYVVTAQDVAGNVSAPSSEAAVVVFADTTAPTASFTAPLDQATVSNSISVSANASDDVGVVGVQFRLDGAVLGAEDTTFPYSVTWNTTTAGNGGHQLSAVARDAAGNLSLQQVINVTVSNTGPPPSTGLVLAYGLNEGVGTAVTDASGTGNGGTVTAATWTTSGRFGSALSFNGTSAWVTVADAASLDLSAGMTLEAWIYPASTTSWRTVLLKEATGAMSYGLYSANGATRPAGWAMKSGSEFFVNATSTPVLNTWTHVTATYDGTSLRIYINGVLEGTSALPGGLLASTGALRIGGNSQWGEYFSGRIDEVRIYNRALTAAEIQADMNTPVGGTPPPPDTTITSSPAASTTSTSASFSFTSTPAGATFECAIDGVPFASCASPQAYTALNVGSHTFQVRAVNAGGPDPTPPSFTWEITAPIVADTSITSSPAASTTSTSASFSFVSAPVGATFQCALDGAVFAACASPQAYSVLALGNHTFQVRAVNGAGTDPTPASFAWTITAPPPTPPDTTITSSPPSSTTSTSASFGFSSTPAGATFQCALDGAAFAACTSPQAYSALAPGNHSFQVRAVNVNGTDATPASFAWTITTSGCPCSLWSAATVPATVDGGDGSAVELGVKFLAERTGYITAIRFYKAAANTGTHIGHVWTLSGTSLGVATFSGETASGWQQAVFASPIPVTANTTYIASYYAPVGHYSVNTGYFNTALDNVPLHAPATGTSANGVYRYGASSGFPDQTFNASNYWVDVVFVDSIGPDTTPPTASSTTPANGAVGVSPATGLTAVFSEAIDPATISQATFELRDPANNPVAAAVSYNAATRTASLQPSASLTVSATYTARLAGGGTDPRVKDLAGNALGADVAWSFTTSSTLPPVTAFPSGTAVLIGTLASGTAASLSADENTYYQVNSTTTGTRTAEWYGSFSVPNELQNLSVTYKGRNSASTVTQTIAIWRWTDSTWVQLDSRTVGTTEVNIANLIPAGTLADYVSGTSGAGELRIRVRGTRTANFISQGDLMSITYNP